VGEREKSTTRTFFLIIATDTQHFLVNQQPTNDRGTIYLEMPLSGINEAILCKAFDKCSIEEIDKSTLANARAKFQGTWPKCFRIEDLWLHAHRPARPVE
jgi:hypothetical protein